MFKKLELKIPPVIIWFIFALCIFMSVRLIPVTHFPFYGQYLLAIALFIFAGLIALAGVWEFKKQRTTVNPLTPENSSCVVSTGIFQYTRNPMYVGMALALLSLTSFFANPLGLLFTFAFCFCMNQLQIKPEERMLAQQFQKEYLDYCQNVRRWL